ncbi:MAG: DUF87 domain-containing protein [Chloroflexi bacterium]|jgi:hypothetical protein|nr:DUF87 domain-containing protein [Chloroflexota bacterium]
MIVQLKSTDYTTTSAARLMSNTGFWTALPRITQGGATARLLMTADTLQAEDVLAGFRGVATPDKLLPPGVMAYRVDYEDFLQSVIQAVRYMRLYLVADVNLTEDGLISMLSSYGMAGYPLDHAVLRPFQEGIDEWEYVRAENGYWGMVQSKLMQGGALTPRSLHNLLSLDFPIWASLHVHTFSQSETLRLLREKAASASVDERKNLESQQDASDAEMGIVRLREEMGLGAALHAVSLHVMVGAPNPEVLKSRLEMVRGSTPLEMYRVFGAGRVAEAIFSANPYHESDGAMMTTPGVAMLAGSALSFRRRTETRGILLGVDRNQAPVILDIFDDRAPSYNMVILGITGSGKTFAALLLMLRHLQMGVRLIIVDPQGNVDLSFLGEGIAHKIVLGTNDAAINLLDITHDEIGNQVEYVMAMLGMLGVHENKGWERAVLDSALMSLYQPIWGRDDVEVYPTLPALFDQLREIAMSDEEADFVHETAALLAYNLRPYVDGSRADLFAHHTNVDFALRHAVNVFDVSRLPQQEVGGSKGGLRSAMLAILVANINQAIRRRRRAGDTAPILFFVDEMGILMRDPVIASYISTEYKTARARLVGMIVADQDLHSLLGPKDEKGLHHGIPMLANAANTLIFHQKGSEREHIQTYFPNLPQSLVESLPAFSRGTCITQLPDDLLVVNVIPSRLDRVLLSSRLQDRLLASQIIKEMSNEIFTEESEIV